MGFQILDKNDNPIYMNDLDESAAKFWGLEVHPKQYAEPIKGSGNWFDIIGHTIHSPEVDYTTGWNNIKCSLWAVQSSDIGLILMGDVETVTEKIIFVRNYLRPYFELIDHWESKGYIPLKTDK